MKLRKRIQQLSIRQLTRFAMLLLKHPFHIIPTLKATRRTFEICDQLYGKDHQRSNKGNAFRHAVWNVLLCKKTFKNSKNKQKSVFWAQRVTDLYEKMTQNELLDEAMDLHNNAVGRICFLNYLNQNEQEIIKFLQKKAENAKKVANIEELSKISNQMVYLYD